MNTNNLNETNKTDDAPDKITRFKLAFVNNLKEARKENGLLQSEVADKIGCAVSTYANWEQGRRDPSITDIFLLIEVLGIEANDLFVI